jgi:hypothetical protein
MSTQESLRHPLTILLIGTVLGSILIPWGADVLSKQRAKQEAKTQLLMRILEYDTVTRQGLLSIHTRLYTFHENMRSFAPSESELRTEQGKLFEAANNQYLEFDKGVWPTAQQIMNELRVHKLVSDSELEVIHKNFDEYQRQMWYARDAIADLWHACMSAKYSPSDPSIDQLHGKADEVRKKLEHEGSKLLIKSTEQIK